MKCPKCGGATCITDCRAPDYDEYGLPNIRQPLLKACVELFDSLGDFKARRRKCKICGDTCITVELAFDDLDELLKNQGDTDG